MPKSFSEKRDQQFQRWKSLSGTKLFKNFMLQFLLALFVCLFTLVLMGYQTVDEYSNHSFVYKLIEDSAVSVFTMMFAAILQYAVWFGLVCFYVRKNHPRDCNWDYLARGRALLDFRQSGNDTPALM
jgi:hypothetical protein